MKMMLALAIFVAAALGGALALQATLESATFAPISWAVAISAVVTFFTLLLGLPPQGTITKSGTRNAITGTFMVTYFVLLGLFVFFRSETKGDVPAITTTLVTNFTFLMGVVIAFHFGTTTFEKVAQINAAARSPKNQEEIAAASEAAETEGTTEPE